MAEEGTQVLSELTGEEFVTKATELFEEFRQAWQSEWTRLNNCEQAYLAKHWDNMSSITDENDQQPVDPIIMSTVENLKADFADNFPQAIIQAESPDDREVGEVVNAVIKQNHDSANYRKEYMASVHDLLVGGWCCEEAGYDNELNHGLGGAYIRNVDNHSILFDPQVRDIQLGRAIFKISPVTPEWLDQKYPSLAGQWQTDSFKLEKDNELKTDDSKTILMIEVWHKQYIAEGQDGKDGHWVVHMAHMAGGQLLDDSRDEKPDGYFEMGMYPFEITALYSRKNSMLGYGIVDFFEKSQQDADRLDSVVMHNAAMSAHNKILNTDASGFDTEDLADWTKSVHEGDNINGITWFPNPPLPQFIINHGDVIRTRVRDESGTNDFSRGTTTGGVTAASSIQALAEMANKRVRMACMSKMDSYKTLVRYEIEFERTFNTLPRSVYMTIDGQQVTSDFTSAIMQRESAFGAGQVPIEFMISIKVERENRWSQISQNELVLQMVQLGIIMPQDAVELMNFEGKEMVLAKANNAQQQVSPEQEQAMMEQQALEQELQSIGAPDAAQTAASLQ